MFIKFITTNHIIISFMFINHNNLQPFYLIHFKEIRPVKDIINYLIQSIPKTKQPTNQAKNNIKNKPIDHNRYKPLPFNDPILTFHNFKNVSIKIMLCNIPKW